MKLSEHSLTAHDCPHVYVTGDDDAESPDMRICVVANGTMYHLDMPPKRMATLRDMISDALEEAGLCPHGWEASCICPHCVAGDSRQ